MHEYHDTLQANPKNIVVPTPAASDANDRSRWQPAYMDLAEQYGFGPEDDLGIGEDSDKNLKDCMIEEELEAYVIGKSTKSTDILLFWQVMNDH